MRIDRAVVAAAVLFALLSFHVGAQTEPVHRVELKAGKLVAMATEPAPRRVPTHTPSLPQKPPLERIPPLQKIHPRLLEQIEKAMDLNVVVPLIIVFKDTLKIPRFPALDPNSERDDPKNAPARAAAAALVREIEEKRVPIYDQHKKDLKAYDATVIETFWPIDAVVAKMPLKEVEKLAERVDVHSIEQLEGEPPPVCPTMNCPPPAIHTQKQDDNSFNDVDDGRARIASDPYRSDPRLKGGFIGLLDSGIRSTHRQFVMPSPVRLLLDCVTGGADCNKPEPGKELNPDDDCSNHGSSTAAILAGNERAGAAFLGVTNAKVDSFKVYPSTFSPPVPPETQHKCNTFEADRPAVLRGFKVAVAALDQVIVAELEELAGERGSISLAANAAFDTGAVVVAANGNYGPNPRSVAEPANASRVLGVGNFDVMDSTTTPCCRQSRGPTKIDGRIKPDFQAPTSTETASNGCAPNKDCRAIRNDTAFQIFGGTSGAAPYAAGAATLMRNLVVLATKNNAVDPGLIYALMILSGQRTDFETDRGTGPLRLPTNGMLRWGAVSVNHGEIFEVRIPLHSQNEMLLDAALWWPEWRERPEMPPHNNIDLTILDPKGREKAKSRSVPSVFERARAQDDTNGAWRIRIHGTSVPNGPQPVYFAILSQPAP